jgi:uncharacterized metal-binding protein YceD (DUF177 family)
MGPAPLRPAQLSRHRPHGFEIVPDAGACAALAGELELLGLRKLRLAGELRPEGAADWRIEARLGATVVQPCDITLEPVTTRIEEPVTRLLLAEPPPELEAGETEMPEDDTVEPLGRTIDLERIMREALALALPAFPRAPGAELGVLEASPPGAEPLDDTPNRPFEALAALRDRLGAAADTETAADTRQRERRDDAVHGEDDAAAGGKEGGKKG